MVTMNYKVIRDAARPTNRVLISGEEVLNMDVSNGWTICDIQFDDTRPAYEIDELVITFVKVGSFKDVVKENSNEKTTRITS